MPGASDPSRCPLCGAANGCAKVAGDDAAECWCMSAVIPGELHARIPEAARERVCVCEACVRSARDGGTTSRPLRTVER